MYVNQRLKYQGLHFQGTCGLVSEGNRESIRRLSETKKFLIRVNRAYSLSTDGKQLRPGTKTAQLSRGP